MTDMNPLAHDNSAERIFPRFGERATTAEIIETGPILRDDFCNRCDSCSVSRFASGVAVDSQPWAQSLKPGRAQIKQVRDRGCREAAGTVRDSLERPGRFLGRSNDS